MRTETGPLRPSENDWQGYFFRGDNALGLANELEMLASNLESPEPIDTKIVAGWMRRLADKLRACRE